MNLQEHIRRILREEVELNPLEYLGMPEISKIEIGTINNVVINGDLYQFKTQDGLISGVMISPTEFRIEGISANEVGKGQGSKMFESLISYLKSKGVTTLTTESAGEGAVKMHNKAVEKGLLIKVKEDGRFATFTINNTKIDPTTTTNTKESLLNPNERVYDYEEGRDTVPEKLPFDIDKLVNSGVVFVTPAINGNPKSKNYKKWMKTPHTHLISLYNVENSSEDGWILKAITKRAPTKGFKGNFVDKIYDGKYNQILWGLEKLGINPMDMLIDMNLQESIRKVLREETEDITKKILNFLKRRFKVKKIPVRDEKTSRIVKTLFFEKNGKTWAIEKGLNERHQIAIILDFLITFEVIDPFNIYKRDFDYNEQKIVDAIKIFIDEVLL